LAVGGAPIISVSLSLYAICEVKNATTVVFGKSIDRRIIGEGVLSVEGNKAGIWTVYLFLFFHFGHD